MEEKNKFNSIVFSFGIVTGIALTLAVVLIFIYFSQKEDPLAVSETVTSEETGDEKGDIVVVSNESEEETTEAEKENETENQNESGRGLPTDSWDATTIYNGGETVSFNGRMYKCRWWTQGDEPGASKEGPWEDLLIADPNAEKTATPKDVANVPVDASTPVSGDAKGFKIVGYYPSWSPDSLNKVDFNVVTHVNYAFAIPNADGTLKSLENPETAKALIKAAHKNKAKVLLAVGGWSYHEVPLEPTFVTATETKEKREKFVGEMVKMCNEYGFDGIDMDWEHPRVDGNSAVQYEETMKMLADALHKEEKLLTAAVLSGATADGNIYYDAAAHTNAVLNCVDWINVMAYDGGDGERHSSYSFAENCGKYWKEDRGLPAEKVVLGVPFYGRPSWAAYEKILLADKSADQKDVATVNGMEAHYNGIPTITKKTKYAKENLGGIMIWELTQDTTNSEKSLLQAIGKAAK